MAQDGTYGQVGQGGAGPDQTIPECPVCHAYGGGGHGGLCPNMHREPEDWMAVPPAGLLAAPSHERSPHATWKRSIETRGMTQ